MSESTDTSNEKICENLGLKLSRVFVGNLSLNHHYCCFLFVLQICDNILTHDSSIGLDWAEKLDLLFSMQKHHRVESWNSWYAKTSQISSVRKDDSDCWERSEITSVFISKVVMLLIHRISLEADA